MYCFKSRKKRFCSFKPVSGKFSRKSQITTFMIIGLVVILAAAISTYVIVTSQKEKARKELGEAIETGVLPPLNVYVKQCIEQESPPVIFGLAEHGGVLEPKEGSFLYYNNTKLNYLCLVEGPGLEFSCVNAFLTRQEMQRIISREVAGRLRRCINLKPFEAKGYGVESGRIAVRSRIGKKSVLIEVNYPINITNEGDVTKVSNFSSDINIPLGELYEAAMDIVNKEITEGNFDIDEWMADNNARIIIEKHRPYPDKVYLLSEQISPEFHAFNRSALKFQFALQQNPSIAQKRPAQKKLYGLCNNNYDDICFENVNEAKCRQVQGTYNPLKNIRCSNNFRHVRGELCNGHECRDCTVDFWGRKFDTPRKHGESWCDYDAITGKGYDYVGSRHYKHSCIDGEVRVEECRDYREDLCTQNVVNGKSKAVCRVNRWFDCSLCTTEECCNDIRFRDCFWRETSTLKQKCVPYVPPGLRFWENEGIDICLRANNEVDCEGISCPNIWIDENARYCFQQGDCGNYRNIADQMTYEGFFQSDPADSVRYDDIIPKKGYNINPLPDRSFWDINLPLDTTEQAELVSLAEVSPLGNIPLLLSAGMQFIDEIINLDISDFINPFTPMPRIHIVDFALCSVWTAPTKVNHCVLCSIDPARPCTEYMCESLGERCEFSMDKGIPKCELPSLADKEPPKIEFNEKALTKGYKAEKAKLAGHSGVKIVPAIIPHRPFTFSIKTSELTRCRIKLAPRLPYFNVPSFWLNDPGFKSEHNLTLRLPPKLSVPKKLLDFLNITSTNEVIPLLENVGPLYEHYKEKLRDKLEIYTAITGDDLIGTLDVQIKPVIDLIKGLTPYFKALFEAMIRQFDRGGYYMFVECSDRAGNLNEDEFFVQFEVDDDYIDNEAPVIVHAVPANNSKISLNENIIGLSLYIDEPAECRYSSEDAKFEDMEKSFVCNTGYHISPVAGGTYECNTLLDRNAYKTAFIRCKDNPTTADSYSLDVIHSDEMQILGLEKYNYSNISIETYVGLFEPSNIEVPAKMMDSFTFKVKDFPVNLKMYIGDDKECRFSNTTANYAEMSGVFDKCRISDDAERGMYECDALLDRPVVSEPKIGNYTFKISKSDASGLGSGFMGSGMDIDVENSSVYVKVDGMMSGQSNIDIDTENLELVLNISNNVECRYRKNNKSLNRMDCLAGNRTVCDYSANVQDYAEVYVECLSLSGSEENYHFNIGCGVNVTEGNTAQKSYVYTTVGAEPLNITVKPSGTVKEKETELIVKVSGSISRDEIICGFNDNPFYGILNMERIADDRFGAHIDGLEDGKKYAYYVQCYDKYGNEAEGFTEFEVVV